MLPHYPDPESIGYDQNSLDEISLDGISLDDISLDGISLGNVLSLREMIKKKITLLKQDVQNPWYCFFRLPGIASRKEKQEKIAALENLQIRILIDAQDDICTYSDDVFDGETLALFKRASEIFTSKFTKNELEDLSKRDPCSRLFRGGCGF